jgi:hypothetical protein
MRSITAFTYGQWLQMNITTSPFGPRAQASVWRLPSTPFRSNAAAFQPNGCTAIRVCAMGR